ncbi:MAG TPA: hypothetical protein VKA34_10215 [Balneolales bacterium]|nr:hypothetical protein [Balneolales bacterium]
MKRILSKYSFSIFIGVIALFIPLVRNLHIESAILASVVGSILAAYWSTKRETEKSDKQRLFELITIVYAAAIPLLINALINGCFSVDGLGYWIFYPSFSIYFVYSIGRYFRNTGFSHPLFWTWIVILWVAVGEFLIEFYMLPQVYFYNHIWGGWPGPIYDEAVHFRVSVIYFRLITFCWASIFWLLPEFWNSRFAKMAIGALTLSLVLSYANMAQNRIISPRSYIQQVLGGKKVTKHFDFYYDKKYYSKWDVYRFSKQAEFDFKQITDSLQIPPPKQKIQCYFYANPWQKKELVGAKYTSYVPVWSPVDQLHISKSAINDVLKHEMVHVLAKQFGNRWIHASWSIGLVEGLAVAINKGESSVATLNQLVAASKPWPDTKELEDAFSFGGFYSGRGNVNYTTAGSFVQYLLKNYSVSDFKKAYKTSDIKNAYPVKMKHLVSAWHKVLKNTPVDSADIEASRQLFSVPSLFERKCPHTITPMYALFDQYRYNMAIKDTAKAIQALQKGLHMHPENGNFWVNWSYLELKKKRPDSVIQQEIPTDTTTSGSIINVRIADAYMMADSVQAAQKYLSKAKQLNRGKDRIDWLAERLNFRDTLRNWRDYLNINYRHHPITPDYFDSLAPDNRLLAMHLLIQKDDDHHLIDYDRTLLKTPLSKYRFDNFLEVVKYTALKKHFNLAEELIQRMESFKWRLRDQQRLESMKQFVFYLK